MTLNKSFSINKFKVTNNSMKLTHIMTIGDCSLFHKESKFEGYEHLCFVIGKYTNFNDTNSTCTWGNGFYDLCIESAVEIILDREISFKIECDILGKDNIINCLKLASKSTN